ncbi:MAG: phosphatidylserine decarboxylase [Bacteroidales bacterium]|nr:phosphatidylserine decarboxylase [Bacteroidales bacterium]
MRIDKDSILAVVSVWAIGVAAALAVLKWVPYPWLAWVLLTLLLWYCIFVTYFFRIPKRRRNGDNRVVTSGADGIVSNVQRVFEPEYLKRKCIVVSVFMNFYDMHANFWPVSGTVTYYKYHPGKHFLAFLPKASLANEHTSTCVRTDAGKEILFRQLAGGFARRIVNYGAPGLQVEGGTQCGIIKFGSRFDIYLPAGAKVKVKKGMVLRAGESVVALLQ